jgi:hypothetical protein
MMVPFDVAQLRNVLSRHCLMSNSLQRQRSECEQRRVRRKREGGRERRGALWYAARAQRGGPVEVAGGFVRRQVLRENGVLEPNLFEW